MLVQVRQRRVRFEVEATMFKTVMFKATTPKATTAIVSLLFVACVRVLFHPASAPLAAAGIVSALLLVLLLIVTIAGDRRTSMLHGRRLLRYAAPVLLLPAVSWAGGTSTAFNGVATVFPTGSVALSGPVGMAVDSRGNVYIADTGGNQVVIVTSAGVATALTSFPHLSPTTLHSPEGVAVGGSGNLYIADSNNGRVLEVAGGVASVVNTGSLLVEPLGVAVDAAGDLYVSDGTNNDIVEVPAGGAASVLAISGLGTALAGPQGLAVDVSGNLYIADSGNSRVVKVTPGGVGSVLNLGGLTLTADLGVAVDEVGNVYIADLFGNRIVMVTPAGGSSVLNQGSLTLNQPRGVAVGVSGAVYIADFNHARIVEDQPTTVGFSHVHLGAVTGTTLTLPFFVGSNVTFGSVAALTLGAPNLDFTVASTTCVSGTTSSAACTVTITFQPTAAGLRRGAVVLYTNASPPAPFISVPLYATGDAPLAALSPGTASLAGTGGATLSAPFQIAFDGAGNMYVANYGSVAGNVVKVAAGGGGATVVSTAGFTLAGAIGVVLDGAGNLYISDHENSRILEVTAGGVVSVLSITGLSPGLSIPTAIAMDAAGNLYISDYGNGRIVKVTPAGAGSVVGSGSFTFPSVSVLGVAVDAAGTVYIPDSDGNRVVKVTASGAASLVVPAGITPVLSSPRGVAVDAFGNLYIADAGNRRIVEITTAGVASVVQMPGQSLVTDYGVTVDTAGNVFIPDFSANHIVKVSVADATLTFPNTNVESASSPQTATVTNIGDLPLVFTTHPTYTANFSEDTGDDNLCALSTSLAAGTACDVAVDFTPQSAGSLSASIVVTNNNLNLTTTTQTVAVSGTGLAVAASTQIAVSTNPAIVNIGQTLAITAAVTDTAAGHAATVPTGGVTFTDTVGSTAISLNGGIPVTLNGSGRAILSGVTLSGAGLHTISAFYPGVSGVFLPSAGNTTALVSAAITPTISWTPASGAITYGTTLGTILNATATNGNTAVAGTFTYTATLAGGRAIAVTGATLLGAGSYTLTATFTPTNTTAYASTSASVSLMVMTAFTVTAPTTPVTVAPGGAVTVKITVPPLGGAFNSLVTLSASGLPPGATATFNPPKVTPGSAGAPTVMTIRLAPTTASLPAGEAPANHAPASGVPANHGGFPVAPLSLGFVAFGAVLGRKRIPRGLVLVLALAGAGIATSLLTGCGGGFANSQTRAGNYTVTVTGTSGAFHASTTITLAVE